MNVIDFHPDDLLDREIKGTLSQQESRRLRDHLDRCMQCRLELQLRADFEEELGTGDEARTVQTFVAGALRAAGGQRPSRPGVWTRRLVVLLAASIVLATGLAAADIEIASRAWTVTREKIARVFGSTLSGPTPETAMPKDAPLTPQITLPPAAFAFEKDDSSAVGAPLDAVLAALPEFSRVSSESPKPAAPGVGAIHRPTAERARTTERPRAEPSTELDGAMTRTRVSDSPSALLDRAGASRRQGNLLEAAGLYRDLQARFPGSAEARLSIAIVARMQLDLGENAAAVSGFEAYLDAGDRALREEAMAGRAIALGRLGRTTEELDAWRRLVRAYPNSGYAKVARKRIGQDFR
jgi:hypothetical protein